VRRLGGVVDAVTHHGLVRAAVEHAAERAARARLRDGVVERELPRLDHFVENFEILLDGVLLLDAELRVGRALSLDHYLMLHGPCGIFAARDGREIRPVYRQLHK
jgi:hypothetical protein